MLTQAGLGRSDPLAGLPIEFCVPGPPVSLQASGISKGAWKARVAAAARAVLPQDFTPVTCDVGVIITYYHEGPAPDVDNVIKPIQDALNGVIFEDDSQVRSTSSVRRDINGSYRLRHAPLVLASAFATGDDFVHMRITEWADNGVLQ